jgi:hypothetical protein
MCRLGRVQHDGKLKGVLHNTNHRAVLYERVSWQLCNHFADTTFVRVPSPTGTGNRSACQA